MYALCGKGVLIVTCSTCVCTGMDTLTVPCVSETVEGELDVTAHYCGVLNRNEIK